MDLRKLTNWSILSATKSHIVSELSELNGSVSQNLPFFFFCCLFFLNETVEDNSEALSSKWIKMFHL